MRKLAALSAMAIACIATGAFARPASVNLDFNGSGNTLAATGFDNVYTPDPTHFNVAGGKLTIQTQGGDTFGDYENDPERGTICSIRTSTSPDSRPRPLKPTSTSRT